MSRHSNKTIRRLVAAGLVAAATLLMAPAALAGTSGTLVCLISILTGQANEATLMANPWQVSPSPDQKPMILGPADPAPAPLSRPLPRERDLTVSSRVDAAVE
jgi:hypothetical protein